MLAIDQRDSTAVRGRGHAAPPVHETRSATTWPQVVAGENREGQSGAAVDCGRTTRAGIDQIASDRSRRGGGGDWLLLRRSTENCAGAFGGARLYRRNRDIVRHTRSRLNPVRQQPPLRPTGPAARLRPAAEPPAGTANRSRRPVRAQQPPPPTPARPPPPPPPVRAAAATAAGYGQPDASTAIRRSYGATQLRGAAGLTGQESQRILRCEGADLPGRRPS